MRTKTYYNNTNGTIVEWVPEDGRYDVKLDYDDSTKDLKPENLVLLDEE